MKKVSVQSLLLVGFLLVYALFTLGELSAVPFHPDESTQIFMSSDLNALFSQPNSLAWQPEKQGDLRQHYREMDAPLTRYLIGVGRWLAGLPAQTADWDWSRSWEQNRAAGALPGAASLLASRLAVAWLLPFSLYLVFLIAQKVGGDVAGWAALLLCAGNGLILLHARRAMAESALIFTSLLFIWVMLCSHRRVWLLALPLALAVNSKQTAAVLLVPALAALLWQPGRHWKQILRDGLLFAGLFAAVSLVLNPFLCQHPIAAGFSAMQARADFTAMMTAAITRTGAYLPGSLPDQLLAELYNVFIAAPSIAETANYSQATLASETAYFANPLHSLLRGMTGGGFMLGLSLLGLLVACRKAFRPGFQQRRPVILLLIVTLAQSLLLGWVLTIPWQRYYLVLAPISCLWAGLAVSDFAHRIAGFRQRKKPVGAHQNGL